MLGVCDRTFRRYLNRYDERGLDALTDKRLVQVSQRRAPVDEVMRITEQHRSRHMGWNAKHHDNCVSFEGLKLQIPADRHRCHYVKVKVTVLR